MSHGSCVAALADPAPTPTVTPAATMAPCREPDGGGGNKQPTSYLTESCPELQLPILSDW